MWKIAGTSSKGIKEPDDHERRIPSEYGMKSLQ